MAKFFILLLCSTMILSNSSGPPAGYANNFPSFQNCTVCHNGNVNSGNGSIQFRGLPLHYTPGEVYQIEVIVDGTTSRGYGFQASAQVEDITAGSFALNNNSSQLEINGNYIQQNARNESGSWVFNWIAPMTDVGQITFSGSGLATGGSSSTSGDNVYTTEISISSIPLSTQVGLDPKNFSLHNNYPNPFNPMTTINYEILEKSFVEILIHDLQGNLIVKLYSGIQSPGLKSLQWYANNSVGIPVSSGTYLYSIKSNGHSQTKTMIFLK